MSASINEYQSRHVIDQVIERIQEMSLALINDLLSKWKEMYALTEEEKNARIKKIIDYFKVFYDEIVECEEQKRVAMLDKIEKKLQEFYKLQKDLDGTDQVLAMELNEPYSQFLKDIDHTMERYVKERDRRLERLQKLRSEEEKLCECLGCSPMEPFANPVPSEVQLDALQLKVFELNEDKLNRLRTYSETRGIILNLTRVLEHEPLSQFEKDVLDSDECFKPSADNMRRLESLKNELQKKYDEAHQRRTDLLEKLVKLWDRLKVDTEHREVFLTSNTSICRTHMAEIENEIDRCEQLKRENMRQVIESAREQIRDLWDKVTFSKEQREMFKPYHTDHYSEDVLGLHELEIERLEHFYLANQHIFELADKRNELWERMLHLDEIAQDKSRLFNNRGGQLLKEERERKALEVNLPKVDKQLKAALQEYGQPFYWHGFDLLQKITRDWEDRIAAKESKKIARKVENQKTLQTEAILGSRPALTQQKRKGLTPTGGSHAKARKCELADRTVTLKVRHNNDGNSDNDGRSVEHGVASSCGSSNIDWCADSSSSSTNPAEHQHLIPSIILSVP